MSARCVGPGTSTRWYVNDDGYLSESTDEKNVYLPIKGLLLVNVSRYHHTYYCLTIKVSYSKTVQTKYENKMANNLVAAYNSFRTICSHLVVTTWVVPCIVTYAFSLTAWPYNVA